jgi:hypothetical protein
MKTKFYTNTEKLKAAKEMILDLMQIITDLLKVVVAYVPKDSYSSIHVAEITNRLEDIHKRLVV